MTTEPTSVYRLSWTERGTANRCVDPLHRFDLAETMRIARRRVHRAERVTVTRFPRDSVFEGDGVTVWDRERTTRDHAEALTIHAGGYVAEVSPTAGGSRFVITDGYGFAVVGWDHQSDPAGAWILWGYASDAGALRAIIEEMERP